MSLLMLCLAGMVIAVLLLLKGSGLPVNAAVLKCLRQHLSQLLLGS